MSLNSLLFGKSTLKAAQAGRSYHDHDLGCAFTTGIRFNQELGLLEVLSFWAEGVGAATYLMAILSNNVLLAMSGLLFVVFAVVTLLAHLGKAGRTWRVPANLATAWVSRGTIIIAGLIGSGLIWSCLSYIDVQGPYRLLAFLVSFAFAALLMFYAAWLLGSIKAVKLWRGILFPLTFVSHAVTSGIVIIACLNWTESGGSDIEFHVSQIALASLVICFIFTVLHLRLSGNSLAVNASRERLTKGDLKFVFPGAALFLGIVVPFLLASAYLWWHDIITPEFAVTLAVLTVASRLSGDLAYRYAVVRAGAYEPIL